MPFDDKYLGTIFPTRNGVPTGAALERTMLDAVDGAQGIRTRLLVQPDGRATRLKTRAGNPEFVTDEPQRAAVTDTPVDYMTSGAYVFGPLGGINVKHPELTVEPVTRKSPEVDSVERAALVKRYVKKPPADGEVSKIYNQTKMPRGLNGPKTAMRDNPPSIFSGLLRRWVQAQYGTGNTLLCSGPPTAQFDLVPFSATYSRSTGVVRFGRAYFLIVMETSGNVLTVFSYPMSIPKKYLRYLDEASSTEFDALETLALAHAVAPISGARLVAQYSVPSGSPLDYGWNFSLTGNQAVIVIRTPTDATLDKNLWSYLTATFTYGAQVDCTIALTEQVDGQMISLRSPIWVKGDGGMVFVNRKSVATDPSTAQDMPVYVYFVEDELRVVRWGIKASSIPASFNQAKWDEDFDIEKWEHQFFGAGSASFGVTQDYGNSPTHGFYIPGVTVQRCTVANRKEFSWAMAMSYASEPPPPVAPYIWPDKYKGGGMNVWLPTGYSQTSYNPETKTGAVLGYDAPYPVGIPEYSFSLRIPGIGNERHRDRTTTGNHTSCLVVPGADCSAVYIGYAEHFSENTQTTTWIKHTTSLRIDEYELRVKEETFTRVWFEVVGIVGAVYCQFVYPIAYKNSYSLDGETSSYSETRAYHTYDLHYWGAKNALASNTPYQVLYAPTLGDGTLFPITIASISSSLFGDCRYSSGNLADASASNGYPKDITLFIGAA